MGRLPLFEVYPKLEGAIPWKPIGNFPTPVRKLESLGEHTGIGDFYLKDDSRSSAFYGGNKVRKLEFLLADALRKKADTVITVGAAGSNHVLATSIFAGRFGMKAVGILFDQPPAAYVRRNLLLNLYFNTEIFYASSMREVSSILREVMSKVQGKPYYIPVGGSTRLGCLGFVNAGLELGRQVEAGELPEPDYLFAAAGTLGTVAGLYLGCRLSRLKTRVIGVRVTGREICSPERWALLVNHTSVLLHQTDPSVPEVKVSAGDVTLLEDYLGRGYAWFTEQGVRAVSLMKRLEGVTLEGTYTGKALAGALDYVEKHGLKDRVILFWNTYNSVDLSPLTGKVNYRNLPKPFHKYFETPVQRLDPERFSPA